MHILQVVYDYRFIFGTQSHLDLTKSTQRRKPVIRSMSDRREKDANETFKFKDTTALRTKSHRGCSQQLFQKTGGTLRQRPSCPPPKLPELPHNQNAPQRPPRHQSNHLHKTS